MLTKNDIDALRGNGSDFAQSIADWWEDRGYLSDKQEMWARKLIRDQGHTPEDEVLPPPGKPEHPPQPSQQAALDGILGIIAEAIADRAAGNVRLPALIGLTGAAGTGKTFTTEYLAHLMSERYPEVPAQFAATTHPACAVLQEKGLETRTVHKTCGLRPHDDHTKGYVSGGPLLLSTGGVLFVDEASMADQMLIEATMKCAISSRSLAVVWIGDESQLPPVAGGPMFTAALRATDAPVWTLTEIMRNGGRIAEVLQHYRRDTDTPAHDWPEPFVYYGEDNPVDPAQRLDVINDRVAAQAQVDAILGALSSGDLNHTQACVVAYTNATVHAINRRGRAMQYGADDARANPIKVDEVLVSNTSVLDAESGKTILENGQIVRVTQVSPLEAHPGAYKVNAIDMRTGAPISNIVAAFGLAREGMLGRLNDAATEAETEFQDMLAGLFADSHPEALKRFRDKRSVGALEDLIRNTDADMASAMRLLDTDRRRRWRTYYTAKNGLADLRPVYARTVHKSQGMSVDHIVVERGGIDRSDGDVRNALRYVAMSRARSRITLI